VASRPFVLGLTACGRSVLTPQTPARYIATTTKPRLRRGPKQINPALLDGPFHIS
jgi:hypothetical protein